MKKKEEKAKMTEKLSSAECDDLELSDRELDMIAGGRRGGGNSSMPPGFSQV